MGMMQERCGDTFSSHPPLVSAALSSGSSFMIVYSKLVSDALAKPRGIC